MSLCAIESHSYALAELQTLHDEDMLLILTLIKRMKKFS